MPQKIRKLVAAGPRDSGKTSWASIFHRIIPEGKIASVTGERQVQGENSEAASGDESIVAKRRAKPISPTSTEQEDEPCQTTSYKTEGDHHQTCLQKKSIRKRRVSAFANTKVRDLLYEYRDLREVCG